MAKGGKSMDLILWRHAEAEAGTPDAARRLTSRGRRQAKEMARWLRPRLPAGARILASPATRCVETAEALELPFDRANWLGTTAGAADLLEAAGWPHAGGTVVLVGHQPALGRAAALLLAGEAADWRVKKGGLWWFRWRLRGGAGETALRAIMAPDLV